MLLKNFIPSKFIAYFECKNIKEVPEHATFSHIVFYVPKSKAKKIKLNSAYITLLWWKNNELVKFKILENKKLPRDMNKHFLPKNYELKDLKLIKGKILKN